MFFIITFVFSLPFFGEKTNEQLLKNPSELKVSTGLRYFYGSKVLLDPTNLKFTPEYYLLENLSAGLVYEDWKNAGNARSRLAERWEKISDYKWVLYIRKNLKWSNGSDIKLEEIVNHFKDLRQLPSRHISLIKKMDFISYNEKDNSIIFESKSPVQEGLLHELSLADALLLHPKNKKDDWSVSSGPYFVKSYNDKEVFLEANPYFVEEVDIRKVHIKKPNRNDSEIDFRKRPIYAIDDLVERISNQYKVKKIGQPTIVYFFYFNPENRNSRDSQKRKAFARYIRESFANFKFKDVLIENHQVVAPGCEGRLQVEPIFDSITYEVLHKERLILQLNEYMVTVFPEIFERTAQKKNLDLKLIFESPAEEKASSVFAIFDNFSANQRDPLSSWRFLYGEGGPLHIFYPEVEGLFQTIASAGEERRKELLLELHRKSLEEAYIVPFVAEYDVILASERIDLSRINPFDMRMRFFELEWKK